MKILGMSQTNIIEPMLTFDSISKSTNNVDFFNYCSEFSVTDVSDVICNCANSVFRTATSVDNSFKAIVVIQTPKLRKFSPYILGPVPAKISSQENRWTCQSKSLGLPTNFVGMTIKMNRHLHKH